MLGGVLLVEHVFSAIESLMPSLSEYPLHLIILEPIRLRINTLYHHVSPCVAPCGIAHHLCTRRRVYGSYHHSCLQHLRLLDRQIRLLIALAQVPFFITQKPNSWFNMRSLCRISSISSVSAENVALDVAKA